MLSFFFFWKNYFQFFSLPIYVRETQTGVAWGVSQSQIMSVISGYSEMTAHSPSSWQDDRMVSKIHFFRLTQGWACRVDSVNSTLLSLLLAAPVRVSGWTGFTWKMRMLRPRSRTTSRSFFVVLITSTIPSSVMKAEPDWTRRLNLINTHVLCVLNILMYKASTQNSVSTHQRPGAGKVEVKTG